DIVTNKEVASCSFQCKSGLAQLVDDGKLVFLKSDSLVSMLDIKAGKERVVNRGDFSNAYRLVALDNSNLLGLFMRPKSDSDGKFLYKTVVLDTKRAQIVLSVSHPDKFQRMHIDPSHKWIGCISDGFASLQDLLPPATSKARLWNISQPNKCISVYASNVYSFADWHFVPTTSFCVVRMPTNDGLYPVFYDMSVEKSISYDKFCRGLYGAKSSELGGETQIYDMHFSRSSKYALIRYAKPYRAVLFDLENKSVLRKYGPFGGEDLQKP
ncbi:MAG: hypothetical protein KDA84_30095, partial [Planctomycetaceae bacterium]|nr:hypothetical protein [Planctomycetaceae bacterium]